MQVRNFTDIDVANLIVGQYYQLETLDAQGTLLLIGDDGRREYFRIEISFLQVEYMSCRTNFSNEFTFRVATEQEALSIRECLGGTEIRNVPVYCIEKTLSFSFPISGGPPREEKALKFFIAAWSLEITVYDEGDLDSFLKQFEINE